jgi:hypothetical protein
MSKRVPVWKRTLPRKTGWLWRPSLLKDRNLAPFFGALIISVTLTIKSELKDWSRERADALAAAEKKLSAGATATEENWAELLTALHGIANKLGAEKKSQVYIPELNKGYAYYERAATQGRRFYFAAMDVINEEKMWFEKPAKDLKELDAVVSNLEEDNRTVGNDTELSDKETAKKGKVERVVLEFRLASNAIDLEKRIGFLETDLISAVTKKKIVADSIYEAGSKLSYLLYFLGILMTLEGKSAPTESKFAAE